MIVFRHFKGVMVVRLNHHPIGLNQVFQDKLWIADQDCCLQILSTADVGMTKVSNVSFLSQGRKPHWPSRLSLHRASVLRRVGRSDRCTRVRATSVEYLE